MQDDWDKKFDQFQIIKQQMPQYFESPEHISKHLLDVSDYQTSSINHDGSRANLNPSEMREVRADAGLILEMEEAEKMCGFDLNESKIKTQGSMGTLLVTSRSKAGWGSMLAKTDKHINIQTMEQYADDINEQFNPEVAQNLKPSLLDRFRRRV
jgi:hypothetical protein